VVKLEKKLSSVEDQGQTDRVTALPRPYALDIVAGVDRALAALFFEISCAKKTDNTDTNVFGRCPLYGEYTSNFAKC